MADLTAQRTLVKSPPELWTELSEVESLAKHLGELGEIRITKVEPESTVAWEGEDVSGTVALEQSGWGTKVTFTATVPEPDAAVEPVAEPDAVAVAEAEPVAVAPEPEPEPDTVAPDPEPLVAAAEPRRRGFLARWLFRQRSPRPEPAAIEPEPASEPEPVTAADVVADPIPAADATAEPAPAAADVVAAEPAAPTTDAERVQRVLDGTLDALGRAHHRPFSRG